MKKLENMFSSGERYKIDTNMDVHASIHKHTPTYTAYQVLGTMSEYISDSAPHSTQAR